MQICISFVPPQQMLLLAPFVLLPSFIKHMNANQLPLLQQPS